MATKRSIRTTGAESQWSFDNMISDIDISGLTHLGRVYDDRLTEYKISHDLNNPDYFQEYKEMQQRRKMITEELSNRLDMIKDAWTYTRDVHFNENYDVVIQEENGEIKVYRPSLTERGTVEFIELEESDVRD